METIVTNFTDKKVKLEVRKRNDVAFLVDAVKTGHNVTSINYVRYCLLLYARNSAFTKNVRQFLHIRARLGQRTKHT